jgi:protease I
VDNGFEEDELISPRNALEQAAAETDIVSPSKDKVKAWKHIDWGTEVKVDVPIPHPAAGDTLRWRAH